MEDSAEILARLEQHILDSEAHHLEKMLVHTKSGDDVKRLRSLTLANMHTQLISKIAQIRLEVAKPLKPSLVSRFTAHFIS